MKITPAIKKLLVEKNGLPASASDETALANMGQGIASGKLDMKEIGAAVAQEATEGETRLKTAVREVVGEFLSPAGAKRFSGPSIAEITGAAGGDGAGVHIRVKCGSESYLATKSVGRHVKTGVPVVDEQCREAMLPSELEYAKAGVFLKALAAKSGAGCVLSEHERSIWGEILEKDTWVGRHDNEWKKEIPNTWIKALLSDSTSGGLEVNPIWFDENLIQFPLLHSELFPMVDLREVPRSSRVEGASIGNPTLTWNTAEGTAISLFNTDSLVAAIDTSIFTVTAAVEVGKDLLSDSPAELGRILEENVGQRLANELDDVIANGDGTTQPQGIFVASGTTGVNSTNGASGPPTLADYEGLLFAVGKQYRTSKSCCFISNDTVYARSRGIKNDAASPSTDQRRVFGMEHENYMTLGRPSKIQNDIANTKIAFGDMKKYRLYRRLGMAVEWVTSGENLSRRNLALLIVRARFGGKVVDASAFSKIADAQT